MKKVFKNPVVTFILGALIFSSISVYAAHKYAASNITYKDTTLDQALNTLYTKTNTYKNLTETTDVSSSNLLNGVKAYTNSGTLVTGSIPSIVSSNTNLTSGQVYTIPQGYHDGTGTITAPNSSYTMVDLGASNSRTQHTFDVKNKVSGWENLTAANFVMTDVVLAGSTSNRLAADINVVEGYSTMNLVSYNATTGIVTVKQSVGDAWGIGDFWFNYKLKCVK
ncbi:MAG: hypothetical protein E7158_05695 [Firmicutes bacterium]|nr:hypothetical protein [Bacillota bacterium]